MLAGIQVVKAFAMEEVEKQRFLGDVGQANDVVIKGVRVDAKTTALKNATIAFARVTAVAVGGLLVVRHQISLGTLVAFMAYAASLFAPVQALTGMYQTLRRGKVALETLETSLDAPDALGDAHDAVSPGRVIGEVELRDVTFGYREDQPIVERVSLHVKAGETIALVGPSGAGKTTLMILLQRLYDVREGQILIDGIDVRRLKQRALRENIGVVLQEGILFSGSIRENIAFGRREATMDEIVAAARAANAHDFIVALPEGCDTRVGERGASLSGAERQRIVSRGRTTFVIAHRLSTVTDADRIAVVKDRRIFEMGTHDDLLARDSYCAGLVRFQLKGLLRDSFAPTG